MGTATPSSAARSLSAAGTLPAGGPPLADSSFAGLLATIAAPQNPLPPWNDDGLADDVASISYERALRSHVRVRPGNSDTMPAPPPAPVPEGKDAFRGKAIKSSSITIRLSEPECAQLRRRAAEAGMTVSAYLRSCTLEVESLRSQVKQTLAEMRNPLSRPDPEIRSESCGRVRRFFTRLWHGWRSFGNGRPNTALVNPGNPLAPVRY